MGGWINFVRRLAVWALKNVLQFFSLIEIFENSTSFSISIHLFIALKRWNFPDNLDFKGKIGATFLIRSHSLSLSIENNMTKKKQNTKKLSMGPFKKYVTCIMALFTPFNYLSHSVNFTVTLSLCYSPNFNKKL